MDLVYTPKLFIFNFKTLMFWQRHNTFSRFTPFVFATYNDMTFTIIVLT